MPLKTSTPPNFKIGTALQTGPLKNDPQYRQIASREFNLAIPENAMKCSWVCQQSNAYHFKSGDKIVEFAQQHNQAVRGHVLCWHMSYARWMQQLSARELENVLRHFIWAMVDRYKGQCYAWDVLNEAINDQGKPRRNSIWQKIEGYIPKCFQWAHEADPDAQLIYLDYRLHTIGRWNAVRKMVAELKANGIPIHGVGFQLHHEIFRSLAVSNLRLPTLVKQFKDLGVAVHICEASVPIYPPTQQLPEAAKYKLQGEAYAKMMRVALESGCESFSAWGFIDKYAYAKPPEYDKQATPCLFDGDYQPKPAYFALEKELVRQQAGVGCLVEAR